MGMNGAGRAKIKGRRSTMGMAAWQDLTCARLFSLATPPESVFHPHGYVVALLRSHVSDSVKIVAGCLASAIYTDVVRDRTAASASNLDERLVLATSIYAQTLAQLQHDLENP